jgi:hypothetical protein
MTPINTELLRKDQKRINQQRGEVRVQRFEADDIQHASGGDDGRLLLGLFGEHPWLTPLNFPCILAWSKPCEVFKTL